MLVREMVCDNAATGTLARKVDSKNTRAVRWARSTNARLTQVHHPLLEPSQRIPHTFTAHRSPSYPPEARATIPSTSGLRMIFRELFNPPLIQFFKALLCSKTRFLKPVQRALTSKRRFLTTVYGFFFDQSANDNLTRFGTERIYAFS